jgi:hypothetical protein
MPLAIGSVALPIVPLPFALWAAFSWVVGLAPAWWINKRGWADLVPWATWFCHTHYVVAPEKPPESA